MQATRFNVLEKEQERVQSENEISQQAFKKSNNSINRVNK